MFTRSLSKMTSLLLVLVVCGIGGLAAWFFLTHETPRGSTRFRECATEVGLNWMMHFLPNEQGAKFKINLYDHGSGVAIGDFDGDGLDDIYLVNELGPNALYRNKGDGTFEDVAEAAGVVLGDRVCVGATFNDYDNDGKLDLYVTSTRGGNILFRNVGSGKFKEVTKEAGLTHVGHSQTGLFFDYDNDGFLDLFLTNTASWTTSTYDKHEHYWIGPVTPLGDVSLSPLEFNVLYRNNGNGTFTDVTEKMGLKGRGWAGDAAAFDYNGDGRMDLFVGSMFGRCQLYRNDGDHFTDVTLEVLDRTPWGALGAKVFDLNNDGRLDLFVVDMHSDMWTGLDREHLSQSFAEESWNKKFPHLSGPAAKRDPLVRARERKRIAERGTNYGELLFGNGCYRADGEGKFTEISDEAGLETFWPWGIADGDFDNDGRVDIFITAGMGYPFYYWPNSLMMNQGNGIFHDRAETLGIEPPSRGPFLPEEIDGVKAVRSSRTAAVADFFGDGRLSIVVNNFNDQPYFFKNEGPRRNYVAFRLQGTKSNRDAVGAVVRLYQQGKVLTRQVQSGGGYLSQCSRTVHFGLGDAPRIDYVEITWPSGTKQRLEDVKLNARQDVIEPLPQKSS